MKKIYALLTFALLGTENLTQAQVGGQRSFEFLNLPSTVRQAALSGVNLSTYDGDGGAFLTNPALLADSLNGLLTWNNTFFLGQTNHTSLGYLPKIGRTGTWGLSLQHLGYGQIAAYDEFGNADGTVSASDFALGISKSHQIAPFSIGATAKWVGSQLGSYQAHALCLDFGAIYKHPNQDLRVGFLVKNLGVVLRQFTPSERALLPFDVQVGASYKPEQMPLRMSLSFHQLYKYDIVYADPYLLNKTDVFGNPLLEKPNFGQQMLRRMTLGTELVLGQAIHIRLGYNFLRRKELLVSNAGGAAGLTFGGMLRLSKFEFNISRSVFHLSGGVTSIGLQINTASFTKKKIVIE